MTKSKGRRWIENFLLLIAAMALSVWVWSVTSQVVFQDWETWVFDRKLRGAPATVFDFLVAKEAKITGDVCAWLGIPQTPKPPVFRPSISPPANRQPVIGKNDLVGRLVIPRLHLRAIVREGAEEQTLRLALGHIPSTALPWQNGNVGVAGHRDTLFRGLRKIRKDDLILFETLSGNYVYQVEATEIVRPQNVSVLKVREHPELTLVTCYPFYYIGPAPERFIVIARLVSASGMEQRGGTEETASQANSFAAVPQPFAEDVTEPPTTSDLGPIRGHRTSSGLKRVEHKPGVSRVTFEVSKGHSRPLSPGISLGLTATDAIDHRASGWIWVMPDRRTIWLRNQSAQQPVIFYGHLDGKQRELVITRVDHNSVAGYLLLPAT
jgi:sortase A